MHEHHATLRLLLKLLAVVLLGVAAYIVLVYGISRHAGDAATATSTPVTATSTPVATSTASSGSATSSPISTGNPPTASGNPPSTAASSTDWEAGMQIVTSSDNNGTVTLAQNERFVIQLGSGLNWTLSFDPASAITRVPNSTTADGIQGVYEADGTGTVTMRATGAPICKPDQACPMFLAVSTITFVIK